MGAWYVPSLELVYITSSSISLATAVYGASLTAEGLGDAVDLGSKGKM